MPTNVTRLALKGELEFAGKPPWPPAPQPALPPAAPPSLRAAGRTDLNGLAAPASGPEATRSGLHPGVRREHLGPVGPARAWLRRGPSLPTARCPPPGHCAGAREGPRLPRGGRGLRAEAGPPRPLPQPHSSDAAPLQQHCCAGPRVCLAASTEQLIV